jgi:putative CocE/NonD family hydrolase
MLKNSLLLSGLFAFVAVLQGQQASEVVIEQAVPATMRDGIVLRADIYRPKESGRYPVLLQRTPYNKAEGATFGYRAATRGYVAIIQDVRGRYTSEGEWYTFKHETQDGYDTVEWAAALPYSDGRVGMFGGSYVGATQLLAAIGHPPHLAGICPVVTASNYHSNWTYQGGAFEQWFNESWTSGLAQDTLHRNVQSQTNALPASGILPLRSYPLFNGPLQTNLDTLAPYFLDWLEHPTYDNYWKQWSIEAHYSDIAVPALHTAAWYDIFQAGSLHNYEELRLHAANDRAKRGQHLLVVIGGHAGGGRRIGEIDFGPTAATYKEDEVTLAWYDYLFKGVRNEFAGKPVRIFVMGANQWRDEDSWPLKRAEPTKYFLHAKNGANSLRGDGTLSLDPPQAGEIADRFTYDPSNPVPTIGGPLCCDSLHLPPGPHDQRPAEAREDVLVYGTEPFARDTEVTGPVSLDLYFKSSAVDTDFTAKLVDVWPNGLAQNLTEGMLRTSFRNSQESRELINPGEVYLIHIDLWSTSNLFRTGHRLRLEISSSNFPRFDRNLNTGRSSAVDTQWTTAVNTVLHDAEHPSALIVPLMK